ncbi:hypothetical protein V6N12_024126 [Hibiscus sabdariffa]|uniref:Uncharacterized protein n=1 Tax=Hibiscus sabdariffa TaxID=183260 RepID=A0ABR2FZN9_9ROSI
MQAYSHLFFDLAIHSTGHASVSPMHLIVPYSHAFTTPLAPTVVNYCSDSSQGGVRLFVHPFLTPTDQTHLAPSFSSMSVFFMTRHAVSNADGVSLASKQEVLWCHGWVLADEVGVTPGLGPVRVHPLCPILVSDRTSGQSGSPVLGLALGQVQF